MTWVSPFDTVSLGGGGKPIVVTEPVSISATVAAPTKPAAPVIDYITVIDDGSGWCSLIMDLVMASMVGALPGNGIYLIQLPGAYQFDTSVHRTNPALTTGPSVSGFDLIIPGSIGLVGRSDAANSMLGAQPYSPTQFLLCSTSNISGAGAAPGNKINSALYQLSAAWASLSYSMAFRFKKG